MKEGTLSAVWVQFENLAFYFPINSFIKKSGRSREIRTPDILLPKQARYQTALYPVKWVADSESTT